MGKKTRFVFATKSYASLEEAEEQASHLFRAGQLRQNTKLNEIVRTYEPIIRFVLPKKKKG